MNFLARTSQSFAKFKMAPQGCTREATSCRRLLRVEIPKKVSRQAAYKDQQSIPDTLIKTEDDSDHGTQTSRKRKASQAIEEIPEYKPKRQRTICDRKYTKRVNGCLVGSVDSIMECIYREINDQAKAANDENADHHRSAKWQRGERDRVLRKSRQNKPR